MSGRLACTKIFITHNLMWIRDPLSHKFYYSTNEDDHDDEAEKFASDESNSSDDEDFFEDIIALDDNEVD